METVMFVLAVRAHGAWSRSRARLVFERFFNRGDGSRAQALCSTTTPRKRVPQIVTTCPK